MTAGLRQLKLLLTIVTGRTVGTTELHQLSGRPERTIHNWFEGASMDQVNFLFSLLERLPDNRRQEFVDEVCRLHPSLQHPRLAHDPLLVRQLEPLLTQPHGCTVIQGGTAFHRAFLLVALGNSAWLEHGRLITGLDRDGLFEWATPPGLQCLPPRMHHEFRKAWDDFERPDPGSLVLLGGLGLPLTTAVFTNWSRHSHVILADDFSLQRSELERRFSGQVHLLTVSPLREHPDWLGVSVQGAPV